MAAQETTQKNSKYDNLVHIPLEDVGLEGNLTVPEEAKGLVVFAHGSGSSRHSPRNRYVAEVLNEHHLATLLIDLLSSAEEEIDMRTRHLRFDIPMLANRLAGIADWVENATDIKHLKIGYFGSSTGGGAALIAAAKKPGRIAAVVSRGGRPDLAGEYLPLVKAPTLLIVGERDPQVIELNKKALEHLNDQSKLDIILRATHLFEEPGTLEEAAHLAAEWFEKYLE